MVFVSDRHNNIAKYVESVYIGAKHVICTRHLKQNLKVRFKEKVIHKLFSKSAKSYTTTEFNKYFHDICKSNTEMGQYLQDANIEKWSKACFLGDRYCTMTTNNYESVNLALKEARAFPIVALFEFIRELISRWFNERMAKAENNHNNLRTNTNKILEKRCMKSKEYGVKMLNSTQFEVFNGDYMGVVDLAQKTCSCRKFDLENFPCAHAIAAIQQMKYDLSDFVSEYYKYEQWLMTYQETIYPLPMRSGWDVPETVINKACFPPNV